MVVTRLHIGGLTPNITSEHIIDRFQTFGEVRGVEDLQLDAVGESELESLDGVHSHACRPVSTVHFPHTRVLS